MALPPKACPACRTEYVHAVTQCADCGGALVLASEVGTAAPQQAMPPIAELVLVRAAAWGWIEALATRLQEEGIDCRVEALDGEEGRTPRSTSAPTCGLFVRPAAAQQAAQIDASFLREQIPDAPEGGAQEGDGEACPACGTPSTPEALECSDCGLPFAVEEG